MELINQRSQELREKLLKISSNRARLDFLKDYYKGKNAIIVGTGPGFTNDIDFIKDNIDENTILFCIKQSLNSFDCYADFHYINDVNQIKYHYPDIGRPITIKAHACRRNTGEDIIFQCGNLPGVKTTLKNKWKEIEEGNDAITFNDDNIGPGENMTFGDGKGHSMMQIVIPFVVHLGIKNVAITGFVGGVDHGVKVQTDGNCWSKAFYDGLDYQYRISALVFDFFKDKFDTNIYLICDSIYKIPKITKQQYIEIFR